MAWRSERGLCWVSRVIALSMTRHTGSTRRSAGREVEAALVVHEGARPIWALLMSVRSRSSAPVGQAFTQGMSSHISQATFGR